LQIKPFDESGQRKDYLIYFFEGQLLQPIDGPLLDAGGTALDMIFWP
jgi:hypothetical protein